VVDANALNLLLLGYNDLQLGLPKFKRLQPLFQRLFCTPATSAPVERIFSQSGLLMRPHRAKLSDTMLETLVYLKCNQSVE